MAREENKWPCPMPLFQVVVCGEELSGKTFAVNYLKSKFEDLGYEVYTIGESKNGQFLSEESMSYDEFAKRPPLERREYSLKMVEDRIKAEKATAETALSRSSEGFKSVMLVDRPWWDGYYYMLKRAKSDKGRIVEYRWEDVLADLILRGRMVFCGYGVFPMFLQLSPLSCELARATDFSENRPSKAYGDDAETLRYRIQSYVDYQLFFLYIKSILIYHKAVVTATVDSEISTLRFPSSYRDKVLKVVKESASGKDFSNLPAKKRLACLEVLKTFNLMSIHAMLDDVGGKKKKVKTSISDEIAESKKLDWLLMDFGTIMSVTKQLLDVIDLGWFSGKEAAEMLSHFQQNMFVQNFDGRERFLDESVLRVTDSYDKACALIQREAEAKKESDAILDILGKARKAKGLDIN